MYRMVYTKQAVKDINNLKSAGLSVKAKGLIEIIKQELFQNPPPYESLVGNLDGYYSRRINIKHRLVYQVYVDKVLINDVLYEGTIKIVRMWTHYENIK